MSGYKRSFIATKCINIYLRKGNFGGNNERERVSSLALFRRRRKRRREKRNLKSKFFTRQTQ
jgi:hypothetical protein